LVASKFLSSKCGKFGEISKNKSFFLIPICTVFSFLWPQCWISFLENVVTLVPFFFQKQCFVPFALEFFSFLFHQKKIWQNFIVQKGTKKISTEKKHYSEVFCF
jgi:hypothetical protein